jgi:ZIP family zinc transporter
MISKVLLGVLIPFIGTTLGAANVFFMKDNISLKTERMLQGFAAGVMIAASVWSLIIPAMEQEVEMGHLAFIPATVGIWIGMGFLMFLDHVIPHLHLNSEEAEGPHTKLQKTTMMVLAVTLHNIPEGMAVGVVLAGWLSGNTGITMGGAFALAIGIAIQNYPEGAIISMPLYSEGKTKGYSFLGGFLSGLVEPIGAVVTILLSSVMVPVLPYLLGFAAGAMIYVVVEELIPEMASGEHSHFAVVMFAVGFTLMMALDTALG